MSERTPSLSRLRLAVIGPSDLVSRTVALGNTFPALELVSYPYDDERDAPALLATAQRQVDSVLFTGLVPYRLATAEQEPAVPVSYVPLKGTGLYRTLYHIRESITLERVSVDTLTRGEVMETYTELGLSPERVMCLEGESERARLAAFHLACYREGRSNAAITALYSVSQELSRKGVPCYRVVPTTADLRGALERALLMGTSLRRGQAVLGIIAVEPGGPARTELELLRLRHEIYGRLLPFAEQFDGHLLAPGSNEYQFFATREPFERSTGALSQTPILDELRRVAQGRVSMGVGIGLTANQAGTHARIALNRAQSEGGDACYIVLENRRLVGPLGSGDAVASELRSLDPDLLAVAKAAGMSASALDRLLARLRPVGYFTAVDVAAAIDVSLRSAHRVISRLQQTGVVEVVGQEKLAAAGRPRQVFRLT